MKCTVLRENILDVILHAEKNTVKNHTLPVLSCVLLEVKKSSLHITATNLEVGVRFEVVASDTEEGVVAVSGNVLSHIISSFPSGTTVSFEKNKGFLLVYTKEGSSKIMLQDVEDFPNIPDVEGGKTITVSSKKIKEALQSVGYCASASTIKPELSSIFIHFDGSTLVACATDSFRLAEKKIPLHNAIESDPFLIPGKSVPSLLRALEAVEDDVELKINKHQLSVRSSQGYITLRLTSGTFPDYTQIIPKEYVTEATFLAHDFERLLRKAVVFSDQFNQTKISIHPTKRVFSVYTKNESVGETTDILHAAVSGEDIEVSFNQKYLIDSLHSIASDSVTLKFSGKSSPAVVRPVGDESFLYLVMPMNR